MSETTPTCILCGTMNDYHDDEAHHWRCDCGATNGVRFHDRDGLDTDRLLRWSLGVSGTIEGDLA